MALCHEIFKFQFNKLPFLKSNKTKYKAHTSLQYPHLALRLSFLVVTAEIRNIISTFFQNPFLYCKSKQFLLLHSLDVWFPFGDRNDPKLRRSFNRGVRYAGYPRTTPTKSTDVSINPELPGNSKSNSENEQPKNSSVERKAVMTTAVQADIQIVNNNNNNKDFEAANIIVMSEHNNTLEACQVTRSISSTTPDFDTFCPTSTSKCTCSCRSSNTPQNNGSTENMSMSQHSQCSNSFSSPFAQYNCTASPLQPWHFPVSHWPPHTPFNIPPTSPVSFFFFPIFGL